MENKQENTDFVNGLLSPELQEGLKDIKPTTEDFEDLDFVTYKYYNAEWEFENLKILEFKFSSILTNIALRT